MSWIKEQNVLVNLTKIQSHFSLYLKPHPIKFLIQRLYNIYGTVRYILVSYEVSDRLLNIMIYRLSRPQKQVSMARYAMITEQVGDQHLIVPTCDNLCQTARLDKTDSKVYDTLIVFLKEFCENVNLKKKSKRQQKSRKPTGISVLTQCYVCDVTMKWLVCLAGIGWESQYISNNHLRPLSARQRNAIRMAFHWRADRGPLLDACWVNACPELSKGSFRYWRLEWNKITIITWSSVGNKWSLDQT